MRIGRTVEDAAVSLAQQTSRRSFLGTLGRVMLAAVGGPMVAVATSAERAEAYHICGHIYTTGSCPHPYHPHTRIDRYGYPVHPKYGYPVDDRGRIYRSRSQRRSKICEQVVPRKYPAVKNPVVEGTWSRCCNGRVRVITDCCSTYRRRINGDAALRGYCARGRYVFCILYRDTNVRC